MTTRSNEVTIGGRQFIAAPLTLGVMRRNASALRIVMDMRMGAKDHPLPTSDEFDAIVTLVAASVSPVEQQADPFDVVAFIDGLDYQRGVIDLLNAMKAVMLAGGFETKPEAQAQGETVSAAPQT